MLLVSFGTVHKYFISLVDELYGLVEILVYIDSGGIKHTYVPILKVFRKIFLKIGPHHQNMTDSKILQRLLIFRPLFAANEQIIRYSADIACL